MKSIRKVGNALVGLVDNAQGARIVAAPEGDRYVEHPVILARTKAEARELIAELRTLVDQLPEQAP